MIGLAVVILFIFLIFGIIGAIGDKIETIKVSKVSKINAEKQNKIQMWREIYNTNRLSLKPDDQLCVENEKHSIDENGRILFLHYGVNGLISNLKCVVRELREKKLEREKRIEQTRKAQIIREAKLNRDRKLWLAKRIVRGRTNDGFVPESRIPECSGLYCLKIRGGLTKFGVAKNLRKRLGSREYRTSIIEMYKVWKVSDKIMFSYETAVRRKFKHMLRKGQRDYLEGDYFRDVCKYINSVVYPVNKLQSTNCGGRGTS